MENTVNLITNTVATCLAQIAAKNNIEYDNKVIVDKIMQSRHEWYPKILDIAKQDAESADLFGNLKRNKIDPLVSTAFSTALKCECIKYAQFLLGITEPG